MQFNKMDHEEIKLLLSKYNKGEATLQETRMVEYWYAKRSMKEMANPELEDYVRIKKEMFLFIKDNRKQASTKKQTYSIKPGLWAIAASLLLVLGFYFYKASYQNESPMLVADIAPGKNMATLTLANGKKIILSDAVNGKLAEEAGVVISKTANGQLIYTVRDKGSKASGKLNTLSTANGETYKIVLPDGTTVWLNSASSLTYSTVLNEHGVRKVKLEGEAYFEVFKDKTHPFIVVSRKQQVEVLGTHFNINSYPDENVIKTTLLEGKVKVSANGSASTAILKPNQQAIVNEVNRVSVKEVNPNDVVDWTTGNFLFNAEDIKSIMRKLSRWYNIEVDYDGEVTSELYYGDISRFKNVSEVLNMLEKAGGVHFKIEGRRITVKK